MPASGKSTVGVVLAKSLNLAFLDTDLLIQQTYGKFLWEMIEADGIVDFIKKEESVLCSIEIENACIATGGSAVYSEKAMNYLAQNGLIVYLNSSLAVIEKRLKNIKSRGVVIGKGQNLLELYNERKRLYERYADIVINTDGKSVEKIVNEIAEKVH
ncbi:MAG: shikimate kinase [Bacillota bacterium]|nr:shikimate kinase [Bacillota bacterium]